MRSVANYQLRTIYYLFHY